jgi:hypothetical protein
MKDNILTIRQSNKPGSHRTGSLKNINKTQIAEILGFEPNVSDDPYKVENSWGFTVDGVFGAIWDYKGSHRYGVFSTYGPKEIFVKLFGADRVE